MISKMVLKFGSGPDTAAVPIEMTPITVFVGPNNSGKSLVLSEIHQICTNGEDVPRNILDALNFLELDEGDAELAIQAILSQRPGEAIPIDEVVVGKHNQRSQISKDLVVEALKNPNAMLPNFGRFYLRFRTLMLNGATRMQHVAQQPAGDLHAAPQNTFQTLFADDAKRMALRQAVHDAFEQHLVIDPTNLGHLRMRLSSVAPSDNRQERGIDDDAVRFHAAATLIDDASDGVRAFTGIMTEVIAGDPKVIIVDEPEAFLHPALAFKLGKQICRLSTGSDKRLFFSTHSPWFVMGCIQSGAAVNIVRLTHRSGAATARILPNADLVKLMRHPLLRSTGMLSGLFYEFVVVTEADSDRAFYQEINERLLSLKPEWGIPNCLFLNAQNKQTVRQLLRPLRDLGIPAAGIVDIDVVKEGGSVFTDLLASANVCGHRSA